MENIISEILAMVEKILAFVQEGEAAGIVDIIKNFFVGLGL